MRTKPAGEARSVRAFSLPLYLLVVIGVSWPFQLPYLFLGDSFRPLLLVSMIAAGVGTWIAGRFIFGDGFAYAGWQRGRLIHYGMAIGLALFLWALPVLLEGIWQGESGERMYRWGDIGQGFATSFLITLVPAFGEEFSWRGYLLPHLLSRHEPRRALLLHGLITWIWHLPFIVAMGLDLGGNPAMSILVVLIVSLIPTVLHAVVFAYLWALSGSLAVVVVYHSAFDEVRDTLEAAIGFGAFAENWQSIVLTILGALVIWRGAERFRWPQLRSCLRPDDAT
jgi:membrane protease YdiL (CAAX protease family)